MSPLKPSRLKRKLEATFAATVLLSIGCGPTTPEVPIDSSFTRTTIDSNLIGAAFVVSGDVTNNGNHELVASAFGTFVDGVAPDGGTVAMYVNNGTIADWTKSEIVSVSDAIAVPNRPNLVDVNGDGALDVIVPGGFFFDANAGNARGSITWWENTNNGASWVRHDVITGSTFSYHSVLFDDFDGDSVNDIVSVAENGGNPASPDDDFVELQLFVGNGNGSFQAPVVIGAGGGGLLEAFDVNNDGNLDIVSPQFFGGVGGQPFVPIIARDASVASFVWFENLGNATFNKHAIGVDEGQGFAIVRVDNLLGDGIARWLGTNHTNPLNIPFEPFSLFPEPAVFEFTPGVDPTQLWSVRTLSSPGDFPVTGTFGQAAPGFCAVGDLNDNGLLDIAVSGDGSRAVYRLAQQPDGSFVNAQLADSEGYGQSGGPIVRDFTGDGKNEVVFGSYDQNAVSIWSH